MGILGPVVVGGAARPFARAGAQELVVYLALHRQGASNERWSAALWPDRIPAASTVHSTVSTARRALGRSVAGTDHLFRRRGLLQLGPAVGTDRDRLARLGQSVDPAGWRAGLSLVRGRPFEDLRWPDWTVLEGHAAATEEEVVRLAVRLAEHELGQGDGEAAEWAVRRGLLASPYDERLYRLLLRAADQQGNPAGVEAAMAALVGLLGGGSRSVVRSIPGSLATPDALDLVHPRTAALYRGLIRNRPPSAGAPSGCRVCSRHG